MGATWEGFALKTVVEKLDALPEMCFFWRTHTGAELDLLIIKGGKRLGFEFKRTSAPQLTRSMQNAAQTLGLERLFVIHAGVDSFPVKKGINALPLSRVWSDPELSRY